MGKYKKEGEKYYRKAKDGSWFQVELKPDGKFYWTQPDGKKVFDDDGSFIQASDGYMYTLSSREIEEIIRRSQVERKVIPGDPSENILNDIMFGILSAGPAVAKGVLTLSKGIGNLVPRVWDAGKSLVTGQVSKQAAKQAAKKGAVAVVKEIPKMGVSMAGGAAVDKTSEHFTGKSFGQNVADALSQHWGFRVSPIVGDFFNPGYYGGYMYGNFITNNYSQLGRYTLDNLYPASYNLKPGDKVKGLFNTFTKPLYQTPPTFFNGRKPLWYNKFIEEYGDFLGPEMAEARFQNGANWARIPEEEIPRTYFSTVSEDGVVTPTELFLDSHVTPTQYTDENGNRVFKELKPGDVVRTTDGSTPGMVGGEHSDYIYLGEDLSGNKAIKFHDTQKLNPQWMFTDPIKKRFENVPFIWNALDRIGGVPLDFLLGYKPFNIEFGIGFRPGSNVGELINLNNIKDVPLK